MAKRKTTRKKAAPRKKTAKKTSRFWWWLIPVGMGSFVFFWYKISVTPDTPKQFLRSIPEGYSTVGIDVSHHQGTIDWDALINQPGFDTLIDFVYCKATEGTDHIDTQWEINRKKLNEEGINNGAYHYFQPKSPPRPQAAHFLSLWHERSMDLPPALDVEEEGFSDQDLVAKMKIWLTEVERISGRRPIIYTSLHFYETKFRNKFPGYKFWLAAYSRKPQYMDDKAVIHWQFSETGRLPGMNGYVDVNVSKLDY